ncbi:MAG: haloacid dehalogenase type II [Pseudomonadota bacterium]
MNRRTFVGMTIAGAASNVTPAWASNRRIKAVAFDGLALFDPRPIFSLAETLFPGRGAQLVSVWRSRQFEYTWLRTMTSSYVDFLKVTEDALVFAAAAEKLELSNEKRAQLLSGFLNMKSWPDVVPVLKNLKKQGLALAPLTNFSVPMLEAGIKNSGLEGVFDHLLSTDRVKVYKPDPRSYQMATDAFGLARDEIAFVAFGSWDAAGAKAYGFPTIWINRMAVPAEQLGVTPDATASTFEALPAFVGI